MSIFDKVFQRTKKMEPTQPFIGVEFGLDLDAILRRIKLVPYQPDQLLSRKGVQIYEKMMLDEEIESAINTLKTIRLSSGWQIVAGSESDKDQLVAEFCNYNMDKVDGSFDDDLREIMGAVDYGISLNELNFYVPDNGKWKGKICLQSIKQKNPKWFNVWTDDFDNIRENGVINISGGLEYGREYPSEKFVIYSFNKKFENVWGTSRLRTLYDYWYIKQLMVRAWAIYGEKFGQALIIGRYKPGTNQTVINEMLDKIKRIKLETAMVIPNQESGIDLEFKEVTGKGAEIYKEIVTFINDQMRKTILGQTLTADRASSGGSYAQSKVHFDILLFYEEQLGKDVSEKAINPQVIHRLVDYNFKQGIDFDEYPKFQFNPLVSDNVEMIVDKYQSLVAVQAIKPIPEDENYLREILKLPQRDESVNPANVVEPGKQPEQSITKQISLTEMFQEKIFTGVRRRSLTEYEKHTDFAEIKDNLKFDTRNLVVKITKIIEKSVDDIMEQIRRKKIIEDNNISAIKNIAVPYIGDIKRIYSDSMKSTFNTSMRQAKRELITKKRALKKVNHSELVKLVELDLLPIDESEVLDWLDSLSFQLAGGERDRVYNIVTQRLHQSIESGYDTKQTVDNIQSDLEYYFQTGEVGEDYYMSSRLESIANTVLSKAYNMGRKQLFEDKSLEGFVEAYEYSAILDDRVRPNHAKMDSRIYKVTDPIWTIWINGKGWYPPNGYRCRCIVVPVTADETYQLSDYPGKDVTPDAGFKL